MIEDLVSEILDLKRRLAYLEALGGPMRMETTTDPGVGDDADDGYAVGSRWINTVTDREFVCTDNTIGAAVWLEAAYIPPTGVIWEFAGSSGIVPAGWLLCDGTAYSTTTYSALFGVIGTVYGTGGAGTFKVPDLRDKFIEGASATDALGATGGVKLQTDVAQHLHGINDYITAGGSTNVIMAGKYTAIVGAATLNAGVAGGVENRPPFVAMNFIIKT